jgi:hypothetical protein
LVRERVVVGGGLLGVGGKGGEDDGRQEGREEGEAHLVFLLLGGYVGQTVDD